MGYLLPFYITPISRHFGHVNDWIFLNSQFFEREITNLKNELIQFTVLPIILSSKIPTITQTTTQISLLQSGQWFQGNV